MKLKKEDCILFIGDSVTDAGRNRSNSEDLGLGFSNMIDLYLRANYPDAQFKVLNRGIGGNQIHHLEDRWQSDCLSLKPDVVTILVGINDTWHYEKSATFGSPERKKEFEISYRSLLRQLLETEVRQIILMEPFLLPFTGEKDFWRKDLNDKITVVNQLAIEFSLPLIPLDRLLNTLAEKNGCELYTRPDGVHPTSVGHYEIAKTWLSLMDALKECRK